MGLIPASKYGLSAPIMQADGVECATPQINADACIFGICGIFDRALRLGGKKGP